MPKTQPSGKLRKKRRHNQTEERVPGSLQGCPVTNTLNLMFHVRIDNRKTENINAILSTKCISTLQFKTED